MAVTPHYTLCCDDVRQENNGKFIVVGLYTPDIVVPAVPFALATLCFFVVFTVDTKSQGKRNINFRLKQGDNLVAGGSGQIEVRGTTAALPLRFGGVQLPTAGMYVFVLEIEGEPEAITHEFRVTLRQHVGPPPAPGGVH